MLQVLYAFTDASNRGQMIGFSFMSVVLGALLALGIKKLQSRRRRKMSEKGVVPLDLDLEEKRWSKLTDSADSLEDALDDSTDVDADDDEEVVNPIGDYHIAEGGQAEGHTEDEESDINQTI